MIKFSRFILIQTVIILLLGLFPVLSWGSSYLGEIVVAFLLSLGNVFIGYFLVMDSFSKKINALKNDIDFAIKNKYSIKIYYTDESIVNNELKSEEYICISK